MRQRGSKKKRSRGWGAARREVTMTAHIMLDNAPFGPDDLQIAGQAFDSARECRR
jgi:hypothetical protein